MRKAVASNSTILALLMALAVLGVACKPGEQAASARKVSASSDKENAEYSKHDETLAEVTADFNVPVSGTNLVFSLGSETNLLEKLSKFLTAVLVLTA